MAMRASLETSEQVKKIQAAIRAANPIRKRAAQTKQAHHPNSQCSVLDRLHQDLADLPTREVVAVKPLPRAKTTRPMLKTDNEGRPYLKMRDPHVDTLLLVQRVVAEYFAFEECYPDEVVLSAWHYFTHGMQWKYFYIPGTTYQIPYTYTQGANFDVMARGSSIYQR